MTKPLFLDKLKLNRDLIWGLVNDYGQQANEKLLREDVVSKVYNNYLTEISKHHSVPVMDHEIRKFLNVVPVNGVILDVGGCWGWHWRSLKKLRPDVRVVICDLIRENLLYAQSILNNLIIDKQIFLVHGNAISLDFNNNTFDAVWSIQTTQHIPDIRQAFREIYRVLK